MNRYCGPYETRVCVPAKCTVELRSVRAPSVALRDECTQVLGKVADALEGREPDPRGVVCDASVYTLCASNHTLNSERAFTKSILSEGSTFAVIGLIAM